MATTSQAKTPSDANGAKRNTDITSNFAVIAGAATAGAAVGMLAMLGRKAAVQAPSVLAGDWQAALIAEHKATMAVFDLLQATPRNAPAKRTALIKHLKHALSKHALEEENIIYPALREAGMVKEADELTSEHGYVKQFLYDLENMPKESTEFLPKVAAFRRHIEEHVADEEGKLFPALHAKLSEEKNKHLTLAMNREGFKLA